MAMCEIAYSSFKCPAKIFRLSVKNADISRIHPTQKPVRLYQWLLNLYAKDGDRILDTHLGSASSAIAAHYGKYEFVGTELDDHYYKLACKRFEEETSQIDMF